MGALRHSVVMMESLGMDSIEEKINQLKEAAKKAFAARGLISEGVVLRKQHSSIFKLQMEESLMNLLQESNMVFSKRGGGLRVAFHFYNSLNNLDALLEAIDGN